MKPGYQTTEFIMHVVLLIVSSILLALGHIDQAFWAGLNGLNQGTYAIGRSIAKRSAPH